jgi:hypothetical protein
MAEKLGQIDWKGFADDRQVGDKLRELVREVGISGPEFRSKSEEEIKTVVIEHIAASGFPNAESISLSISKPDEFGDRMFMGMAHSPLDFGEDINF